jgi:enoyl-CoA hydratase/carnithine racemase
MEQLESVLLRERMGPVLILKLNRPHRMNALSLGLHEALHHAWLGFRDDPDARVAVVTGAGDQAFCAGADLRENDEQARALGAKSAQALLDARRVGGIRVEFNSNNLGLWKPVIAAINGWCLAGGCELAMACDIRVMEEQAQIGLPEVKRGLGAKQTTHKLHYLTTLGLGLEMVWTGDPITAERAYEMGLVNEVVGRGESLARATEIAQRIAARPLWYLEYHKRRVFQSIGVPIDYAMALEQRFRPQDLSEYRRALGAVANNRRKEV